MQQLSTSDFDLFIKMSANLLKNKFTTPEKKAKFVLYYSHNKDMDKENNVKLPHWGNSLENHLGIVYLPDDEEGNVRAEMPVDHRTCQPYGTLHGGASLALAESLAGYGSLKHCAPNEIALGMQVSGNHICPVKVGNKVLASGKLMHKGSTTHIWDVTLTTPQGRLVSSIRVVNYIKKLK